MLNPHEFPSPITIENLSKKLEHGPQLKQVLDVFIPLALKLPELRDNPEMMQETVKAIRENGITDVATAADLHMQTMLLQEITSQHPDWQFWGEEQGQNTEIYDETKNFLFVTDPIEGTNNFKARKDDAWGSVTALIDIKTKEPVIGVIAHPSKNKLYVGIKNGGAFVINCNETGKIINISPMSKKPEYTEYTYNNSPHFEAQLVTQVDKLFSQGEIQPDTLGDKLDQSRKKMIIGKDVFVDPESGALEAVRNSGTIYFKTSAEMAAVFIIIKELGGKVTDGEGNPWSLGITSLIAARNTEDYEKLKGLYDKTTQS